MFLGIMDFCEGYTNTRKWNIGKAIAVRKRFNTLEGLRGKEKLVALTRKKRKERVAGIEDSWKTYTLLPAD